jgi:hypothetical protein
VAGGRGKRPTIRWEIFTLGVRPPGAVAHALVQKVAGTGILTSGRLCN